MQKPAGADLVIDVPRNDLATQREAVLKQRKLSLRHVLPDDGSLSQCVMLGAPGPPADLLERYSRRTVWQ